MKFNMINMKKSVGSMLCLAILGTTLATGVSAYQLGGGISGTVNGITCHGYCYRDTDGSNTVSSEATADSTAYKLSTRVYYTEYSNPRPSSVPCGTLASKSSAQSSGYSTKSGVSNPTHVKGWVKVNYSSNVYWEDVKDYTAGNHYAAEPCSLDNLDVDGTST